MKRKVVITLDVPDDMKGVGPWTAEQCLDDYVRHWLEEGYAPEYGSLPGGITYEGYELQDSENTPCAS